MVLIEGEWCTLTVLIVRGDDLSSDKVASALRKRKVEQMMELFLLHEG